MLNYMVDQIADMDAIFQALANGARRDMLGRLAETDLTVGELAEPLAMTPAPTAEELRLIREELDPEGAYTK